MGDKRVLGVVIVLLAVLAGAVFFFSQNNSSKEEVNNQPITNATGVIHTITLTETGYVPEELEIEEGDTVVFNTELKKPHWPASNLHPSHRDYPEFDPKRPVSAEETWEFTFGQTGEWDFHDHLAPYFTGVIIVK
ncbi:MAG: hypothetical protein ACJKTH_03820 [Patescibacteria group bacterium UBA2163]